MIIQSDKGIDAPVHDPERAMDRLDLDGAATIRDNARRMLLISGVYLSDEAGD